MHVWVRTISCKPSTNDHLAKSQKGREHYKGNKEQVLNENDTVVSADMQKIIMLPQIPDEKSCVPGAWYSSTKPSHL